MVEVHGMWVFILPFLDNEEEEEALPVTTRSKRTVDFPQTSKKKEVMNSCCQRKINR